MVLSKIRHMLTRDLSKGWSKKLFKIATISALLGIMGGIMNMTAVYSNGGKMPVFCSAEDLEDSLWHCPANDDTKFKILCDWIHIRGAEEALEFEIFLVMAQMVKFPVGVEWGIASPGDIIIWVFYFPTFILIFLSAFVALFEAFTLK